MPVALGAAALIVLALWQPWRAKETVAPASPSTTSVPAKSLTEAQQLVAKARKILDEGDEMNRDTYTLAEELLKTAEKLDVTDASAWALHSQLSHRMYETSSDTSAARLDAMRSQAARALTLAPDSDDAKIAMVLTQGFARTDRAAFKSDLDEMARRWPSDPRIARYRSAVYRELGDRDRAVAIARKAFELNPENVRVASDLVSVLVIARHYEEAEKIMAEVLPKRGAGRLWCFDVTLKLMWRGDLAATAAAVARFPSWLLLEDRGVFLGWSASYWNRQPDRALATMQGFPRTFLRDNYFTGPAAVLTALAHEMAGHVEAARADWRTVLKLSEAEIASAPEDATGYYWKAWASARLGDQAAAAEASSQIVQRNLPQRSNFLRSFTMVPLWVALGQPDEVIRVLRQTNSQNFGLMECRASLELSPYFDAMRSDPRFAPLVAAAPGPELKPTSPPVSLDEKAVAVLPFANLSGDKEQEYFSDGLTEEILNALARERDLRVPGRTSSFSFKGKNASAAEIAKALNVSRLVEGSVQRSGTKVRIRVSLTRVADNASEELGTFTEELADIFALQDKVARAVVEKLTHRQLASSVEVLTKNTDAYNFYLKGRALQVRNANSAPEAAKFYEQAVAIDPGFALAWARLAEARFRVFGSSNDRSPEVVATTRTAIDRALTAQPNLSEALIMRANWVRYVESDFAAARRDLDRAEALQPATAELRMAQFQLARDQDNWTDALRLANECLKLDPQNGDYTVALAIGGFFQRGNFAEADRLYARARDIQGLAAPTPFNNQLALRARWRGPEAALGLWNRAPAGQVRSEFTHADLLLALGRNEEARAAVEGVAAPSVVISSGDFVNNAGPILHALGREDHARAWAEATRADALNNFARGNRAPIPRQNFVAAEIDLGQRNSAVAALSEWRAEAQRVPSVSRRMMEFSQRAIPLYARLGMADETIALLRELATNGFLNAGFSLRYSPNYALVRNDTRFQGLMQQAEAFAKAQPDPVDP